MTTPTPNIPLLRKAVEFAEASAARQLTYEQALGTEYEGDDELYFKSDPNELTWNQSNWSMLKSRVVDSTEQATLEHCGTAYCIAGFVASQEPGYTVELNSTPLNDNSGRFFVDLREYIDGNPFSHSQVAREALGLSVYDADALFSGSNSISEVRTIAEKIAGEVL